MDFVNDQSGRHLLRLDSLLSVPDYVKNCPVPESSEYFDATPDRLFAKRATREFPIGEPGHVYLSYAYCKSAGVNEPRLLSNIKAAGEAFSITADLDAIDAAFAATVKQAAAPEPKFAIRLDFGPADPAGDSHFKKAGGIQGFYPIDTTDLIEKSAVELVNDRDKLPMELFVEGCEAIVKAAREAGVQSGYIPQVVIKYGEERVVDLEFVKRQCERRKEKTGDPFYEEFAKSAEANTDNVDLGQYRELLLEADRRFGVNYDDHVLDPYEIFAAGVTKAAHDKELEKWALVNDTTAVPVEAIAQLPENRIRMHFPKAAAEQVLGLVKAAASKSPTAISAEMDKLDPNARRTLLKLLAV